MDALFSGALFAYEDEGDDAELRGIIAYTPSGRLYVVGDDGTIKAADVRQQLLSGEWANSSAKTAAAVPPVSLQTITASPSLELTASLFELNRSGTYAAVAGSALEDPEISRVVVVDLANCRPAPVSSSGSSGGGRHDMCDAVVLDPELFASRPGLRVLQMGWHPDSECHLAVLTSDNTWRLYNTQRAALAEQTFELQLRGRRRLGLGSSACDGRAAVAFSFGPPELWQRFTVYFLTADGSLWSLCPVVPFGCRYPASVVEQLEAAAAAAAANGGGDAGLDSGLNTEAWLQRAFQQLATPKDPAFASGMMCSVPHALDEHVAALSGPLLVATAAREPDAGHGDGGGSLLTRLAGGGGDVAQALLLSRYEEGCTAVAVATARGYLGLHLLATAAGAALPAWSESAPQCVCEELEIQAVRSQVGVVPPGLDQPQLLLLDVVNLSLPADSKTAAADEQEDEELGGFSSGGGGGGRGSAAAPVIALLQDAAAPDVLYAVHCGGAHAVSLPWLPLLAGLLEEGAEAGQQLPAALPQPGAELLLHSSGAKVVAAAAVGDTLSGSALLVLEADGRPRCLRPHRSTAASPSLGTASAGAVAVATAASAGSSVAQADVEAQLATIYGDLLKGPKPCELPRAAVGRPTGAGNPEGQRLLNEAAAALRTSHVEYAHQAHQDLTERLKQLRGELDRQRQRLEAADEVAAAVEQAGGALEGKAARVAQLQGNLAERLRLLAELHWALPRPPSHAEQRFALKQLPAYEEAAALLEADAHALRARVASLHRRLRSVGQAAAGSVASSAGESVDGASTPSIPAHQLRRVREALGEQEAQIASNQQRLAVLEAAVAVAAEARGG